MDLLTIKHIEKSGYESIQQARSVSYHPKGVEGRLAPNPTLEAFGCTGQGGAVDENGWCQYGSGKVYVMNSAGATVSVFDLGEH